MSQLNRNQQSAGASESLLLQNGGMQLPEILSRITLAEVPTLAKEIQTLIDKLRRCTELNVEYVPRAWSLEDARQAVIFESQFKLLLIRYEDRQITEVGSSIRNIFVPEPLPRSCYVEVDSYNGSDKLKLSRLGSYTEEPANQLKHVNNPAEIDPYAITVMHIPDHISLEYIKSHFIGCEHFHEEHSIDSNYYSARKVHFFFRNANHSTRAFKRAFGLQLGLNRIVCFRRIDVSSNERHAEAETTAESLTSIRTVISATSRKRTVRVATPEPEARRVKAELIVENRLASNTVDVNDPNDDNDFVLESPATEFTAALKPGYHRDFDVQFKDEPVEVIDLTANDLGPAGPAKKTTNNDEVKKEGPINLLGTQLVVPDENEELRFSDSSDDNIGSDMDDGSDDDNIFLSKRMDNLIPDPTEENAVIKNEPAIAPQSLRTNEVYNEDQTIEEFFEQISK